MPRIPPRDLNCAFYLYPDEASAKAGRRVGGSGFWVAIPSFQIPNFSWIYGVSNQHVVQRQGASVIRANAKAGGVKIITTEPTDWIEHTDRHDIAIYPVQGTADQWLDIEAVTVSPGMFVTENDVRINLIGVGDDVYLIGRFINHEGNARNTPSARFGNISMMPGEPIYVDAKTPPQESFAVELRSMCGYSGSAVFVTGADIPRNFRSARGPDALLGVHWGYIVEPWTVETRIIKKAVQAGLAPDEQEVDQVSANTGMNGVVPAWRLLELLNMPNLKATRDNEEKAELERRKREGPNDVMDGASETEVSLLANVETPSTEKI